MGELHLEIIVDRLLREFKVEANIGRPQVAYKETIRRPAESDMKYARQSGGKGQYGHVKIKIEPGEPWQRDMCLKILLWAVLFQRNISQRWTRHP